MRNIVLFSGLMTLCFTACEHKPQITESSKTHRKIALSEENTGPVDFDYNEKKLTDQCNSIIEKFSKSKDELKEKYKLLTQNHAQGSKLNKAPSTDVQTLYDLEAIWSEMVISIEPLTLLSAVSSEKDLQAASNLCKEKEEELENNFLSDGDLFFLISHVNKKNFKYPKIDSRLLEHYLYLFTTHGAQLHGDSLFTVKTLKNKISKNQIKFQENLTQDQTTLNFKKEDLAGVNEDFISTLKKNKDESYIVPVRDPQYLLLMREAKIEETRKKMWIAFRSRQNLINKPLFNEVRKDRKTLAQVMGFKNFVDFELQDKMAKNSKKVQQFLAGIYGGEDSKGHLTKNSLKQKFNSEILKFKEFKCSNLKLKTLDQCPIEFWDMAYIGEQIKKEKFQVSVSEVKKYFPMDHTVESIFTIYRDLFGLDFEEIVGAKGWHEKVRLFKVKNQSDHSTIGYFYVDLITREGKRSGAFASNIIPGMNINKEAYNLPVSVLVTNFPEPDAQGNILLAPREVETFFHEFGHIMHGLLTRVRYLSLSGPEVKRDFVEAPSQMLENWFWETKTLTKISSHYQTNSPLPEDLITKMQQSRNFQIGIDSVFQLMLAQLDQQMHLNPLIDGEVLFTKIAKQYANFNFPPESGFSSSFNHIVNGYESKYYGYLWSRVIADDLYSAFKNKSEKEISELGLKLRHTIYEQGNSEDPEALIRKFLGRNFNQKAFLDKFKD